MYSNKWWSIWESKSIAPADYGVFICGSIPKIKTNLKFRGLNLPTLGAILTPSYSLFRLLASKLLPQIITLATQIGLKRPIRLQSKVINVGFFFTSELLNPLNH